MKLMFSLFILIPAVLILVEQRNLLALAEHWRSQLRHAFQAVCALVIVGTMLIGFVVALKRNALHDETTIISAAGAYLHGYPLYPLNSSPVEYGLLYGPATYLVYAPTQLRWFSPLIAALIWSAGAFSLSGTVLFLYLQKPLGWTVALGATAVFFAQCMPFLSYTYGARGDPWILLAIALGMPAANLRNRWVAALIVMILGAFLTDLKVPLIVAGLLPCVSLWHRGREFRVAAISAAALMPVFALSVFLLPGISLQGYKEQLLGASHHGLSTSLFLRNLPFALYMLLPAVSLAILLGLRSRAMLAVWIRSRAAYLVLLGVVFFLATITGAKHGAGPWHLEVVCIPLAVLSAELFWKVWTLSEEKGVAYLRVIAVPCALGLVLLGNVAIGWQRAIKARVRGPEVFADVPMSAVEREMRNILSAHPGVVFSMGYTDDAHYNLTSVRPLLQQRGMPTLIDPVTRNEADLAEKPLSAAVVKTVATCLIPHWILPRQGEPFSMESGYYADGSILTRELYPVALREAFVAHYHRTSTGTYFSLWECNEQAGGKASRGGREAVQLSLRSLRW